MPDTPDELGMALSMDRDVRVHRALARALWRSDRPGIEEVATALAKDPRWSVRSIIERNSATSADSAPSTAT